MADAYWAIFECFLANKNIIKTRKRIDAKRQRVRIEIIFIRNKEDLKSILIVFKA